MPQEVNGEINNYLLNLWRTQLHCPDLNVRDDFFEAGGSSMQVIEMLTTVAERFSREIDFAGFFTNPCVDNLTQLLEA